MVLGADEGCVGRLVDVVCLVVKEAVGVVDTVRAIPN